MKTIELTFTPDAQYHCSGLAGGIQMLAAVLRGCDQCPLFSTCQMSHVAAILAVIKDLTALQAAVKELGGEWRQNQQTYKWYGTRIGDTPLPHGITEEMLGKCEHAIHFPGINYEIGVVRLASGGFTLAWDYWGKGTNIRGRVHDGEALVAKCGGGNLNKLVQLYGVHAATRAARAKGYTVQRKTQGTGAIKLVIGGKFPS